MPRVTVDTKDAISFEPVEPGPYAMTVEAIEGPNKGPNSNYMAVAFTFDDPEVAKKAGKVFRNYPIDGKGAGFFRDFWKASTGQDIPIGTQLDINTDDAIGRHVIAQIENREYEGKLQNEVKQVTAAS